VRPPRAQPQPLTLDELDEREARVGPADIGRKDVQRFLAPVRASTRPGRASHTGWRPSERLGRGRPRDAGVRIRAACKSGTIRVAKNRPEAAISAHSMACLLPPYAATDS